MLCYLGYSIRFAMLGFSIGSGSYALLSLYACSAPLCLAFLYAMLKKLFFCSAMLGGWYAHSVLASRVRVTMLIQRGYVGYAGVPSLLLWRAGSYLHPLTPLPVLSLAVCCVCGFVRCCLLVVGTLILLRRCGLSSMNGNQASIDLASHTDTTGDNH